MEKAVFGMDTLNVTQGMDVRGTHGGTLALDVAASADTTLVGVTEFVSVLNGSDISCLVSSFKALLESMNDPDGTIGKLLTDDSVYDSVDALLNNVDTLVRKIEENPKKYIKISVF